MYIVMCKEKNVKEIGLLLKTNILRTAEIILICEVASVYVRQQIF